MKVTQIPQPWICSVVQEKDPASVIAAMKMSEADGAHGFELNLRELAPEHRNVKDLAPVFRCTTLPIFTTYRRYAGMATEAGKQAGPTDEERMQLQSDLIDVGSGGFDMELDNYDRVAGPAFRSLEGMKYNMDPSSPLRELSYDPAAVEKQLEMVDYAHRRGAEVLASVHCLTRVSNEGVLQILHAAEDRRCDWVKIGRFVSSYEDIVDTFEQTVLLRRESKMPFIMMGMGEYAKMPRLMGCCLGTCLVFCKQTYRAGSFTDQPLIKDAKKFFESIDYKITPRAEEYTVEYYEKRELVKQA